MTVNITTDTDFVPHPQKTEANTSAPIVAETMQHADVKLSKVLFTGSDSSQILLLGKGRGRCVALWECDDGIDPFRILSIKNSEVDPNDASKIPENRVCVGYADGSLAIFNTAKEDLTLMSRIPSVHNGSASRAVSRNGNGVLRRPLRGRLLFVAPPIAEQEEETAEASEGSEGAEANNTGLENPKNDEKVEMAKKIDEDKPKKKKHDTK